MRNYGPPAPDLEVVSPEYGEKGPGKSSWIVDMVKGRIDEIRPFSMDLRLF